MSQSEKKKHFPFNLFKDELSLDLYTKNTLIKTLIYFSWQMLPVHLKLKT